MISDHSTHITEYISPVKMLSFCCICLYVSIVHSLLEHDRKFILSGQLPLTLVNGGVILRPKGQMSRSLRMK